MSAGIGFDGVKSLCEFKSKAKGFFGYNERIETFSPKL